jgi:hypothetical protein
LQKERDDRKSECGGDEPRCRENAIPYKREDEGVLYRVCIIVQLHGIRFSIATISHIENEVRGLHRGAQSSLSTDTISHRRMEYRVLHTGSPVLTFY